MAVDAAGADPTRHAPLRHLGSAHREGSAGGTGPSGHSRLRCRCCRRLADRCRFERPPGRGACGASPSPSSGTLVGSFVRRNPPPFPARGEHTGWIPPRGGVSSRALAAGLPGEASMNAKMLIKTVRRRKAWLFGRLGPRKLWNLVTATKDFALKRETSRSIPAMVTLDISPVCNLSCTACVHAEPQGNPVLERQVFKPSHRMDVEHFSHIIEQIRGKATSVSLYYLGDPYTHPDVDAMCRVAADAGLEVHCSSNFSFGFKDERIRSIVESGLTHLTVCIDGLSQEKYQRTRVGGNIARVLK